MNTDAPTRLLGPRSRMAPRVALALTAVLLAAGCGTGESGEISGTDPSTAATDSTATDAAATAEAPDSDGGFPVFEPVAVAGEGNETIPVSVDRGIITASHPGPGGFGVNILNEAGEHAATGMLWYGEYEGTVQFGMFGPDNRSVDKLEVVAEGEWEVTIAPPEDAPALSLPLEGQGDAVFFYAGEAVDLDVAYTSETGETGLTVQLHLPDDDHGEYLVNSMRDTEETISVPDGPVLLSVRGFGNWSFDLAS